MESVTTSTPTGKNDVGATSDAIRIDAVFSPKFNLALYQNSVPVLVELAVVNNSDRDFADLTLSLSSSPAFIKSKHWHIDAISAGQKFHIPELDLQLDNAMLRQLNESEVVRIQVSLSLSANGELVAIHKQTKVLLSRDQVYSSGASPAFTAGRRSVYEYATGIIGWWGQDCRLM